MYLLDTNVLSELIRRVPSAMVEARFEAASDGELHTSAICIEEIAFGARIAPRGNLIWQRFEARVFPRLTILSFDRHCAVVGGAHRGDWQRQGTPVDYADALIAASALAFGLTLVTRNVQHFDHIPGLKVENWFTPADSGAH